ncbi:MAG: hypothetical protein QOI15_1379 [Pseudonocardiales bacterium]|nr:hypothetical protein [Pseudonocardiales bacterium]
MSIRTATRDAASKTWVKRAARIGLAVRGVVFLVLAYLVARIASGVLGSGGTSKAASGSGVAQAVAAPTGGRVMVFLLGVGLAFYAMFSIIEATLHQNDSSDAKRWAGRAKSGWRAAVYGAFSAYAFYTAINGQSSSGSSEHENEKQAHWTAKVLNWPGGPFWLGVLGVALIAAAVLFVSEAVRRSFFDDLDEARMSRRAKMLTTTAGIAGHLGRAAIYGMVGGFILSAAIENDPSNGQGFDGSVRDFADNAAGAAVLYVIAVALAAFGVYMFCEARYRKV